MQVRGKKKQNREGEIPEFSFLHISFVDLVSPLSYSVKGLMLPLFSAISHQICCEYTKNQTPFQLLI